MVVEDREVIQEMSRFTMFEGLSDQELLSLRLMLEGCHGAYSGLTEVFGLVLIELQRRYLLLTEEQWGAKRFTK